MAKYYTSRRMQRLLEKGLDSNVFGLGHSPSSNIPVLEAPDPSISMNQALVESGYYDSADKRSCCRRKCE